MTRVLLLNGLGGAFLLLFGFVPGAVAVGGALIFGADQIGTPIALVGVVAIASAAVGAILFIAWQVRSVMAAAEAYTARLSPGDWRGIASPLARSAMMLYVMASPLFIIPTIRTIWGLPFGEAFFFA